MKRSGYFWVAQVGCLRTCSSEVWELEGPGVSFSLKQREKAFGLWSERRARDIIRRTEGYLQKYVASGA